MHTVPFIPDNAPFTREQRSWLNGFLAGIYSSAPAGAPAADPPPSLKIAVLYASRTMAHGHDTQTEVIGTAGALSVGRNPRLNRVEIADENGIRNACTPTFFERFENAFLREAQAFVALLAHGAPTGLTLDDAREATRIGIALRDAYASGRPVDL